MGGSICTFLVTILVWGCLPVGYGWGLVGHRVTCAIAETRLTEVAAAKVNTLLLNGNQSQRLSNLCSWADAIKHTHGYGWSEELHYSDTPDFLCTYDHERDCKDVKGVKDMCVTGAINNFTNQLVNGQTESPKTNLTEALLFLGHFIGDVHQPLHVGFATDRGGNTIMVQWYGKVRSLHEIWDSEIIKEGLGRKFGEASNLTAFLGGRINGDWEANATDWGRCPESGQVDCPDTYASESVELACEYVYAGAEVGANLSDDYFNSRWPVVQSQLAKGGVRLGDILNKIFDPPKSQQVELVLG